MTTKIRREQLDLSWVKDQNIDWSNDHENVATPAAVAEYCTALMESMQVNDCRELADTAEAPVSLCNGQEVTTLYNCVLNHQSTTRNILLTAQKNGVDTRILFYNNTPGIITINLVGQNANVAYPDGALTVSPGKVRVVTFTKSATLYAAWYTPELTIHEFAQEYLLISVENLWLSTLDNTGDFDIISNTEWTINN